MNGDKRQARRYHWHSESLRSFVDEPHSAIDGPTLGDIVNLTDKRAAPSRSAQIELLTDLGPGGIIRQFEAITGRTPAQPELPHLIMPAHHDVRCSDVFTRRPAWDARGRCGARPAGIFRTCFSHRRRWRPHGQSLAMVAEVVHGAPFRFRDPARYSLAHGGKDRHPYPVPIKVYDETIRVLKSAVLQAKLGHDERMDALKRLDVQARHLENSATGPSFEAFAAGERSKSPLFGGRSVFGWGKRCSLCSGGEEQLDPQ